MTQKIEASNQDLLQVYEDALEAGDSIAAAVAFKEIYSRDLFDGDGTRFQAINDKFDVYVTNNVSRQEEYLSKTLTFSVNSPGKNLLPDYLNTIIWDSYGTIVHGQEPKEYVRDGSLSVIDDLYGQAESSVVSRLRDRQKMSPMEKASDRDLLQVYAENLEAIDVYGAAAVFKELDSRELSSEDESLLEKINLAYDVQVDRELKSSIPNATTFRVKKRGEGYYPHDDTVAWVKQGAPADGRELPEKVQNWMQRDIEHVYRKHEEQVSERLSQLAAGIGVDDLLLKKYERVTVCPKEMHSLDDLGVYTPTVVDAFEEALENKDTLLAFHLWLDFEFARDKETISEDDFERFAALKEKYGVQGSVLSESDFDIPWPDKDDPSVPKKRECVRHTFTFKAPYPEDQPNLAVLSQVYLDDPSPYACPPDRVLGADGKPAIADERQDRHFQSSIWRDLLKKQDEAERPFFEAHLDSNIKPTAWLDVYEDALSSKDPLSAYYLWNRLREMDDRFTSEDAERFDSLQKEYGVKASAYGDPEYDRKHFSRYDLGARFEGPYPEDDPRLSVIQWHCNTLIGDGYPSDPDLYGADRKCIWPQYFDQRLFQQGVYERVIERQEELNAELIAKSIEQSGLNLAEEPTLDDLFVY